MILPPRPQNHRPLDRSRRTLDLPVTVDPPPPQNRPELDRFAVPPWNPRSPEWLAIEDSLPADHRARAIDEAVDQLDLALLFASYLGVGSKAHRPDLMLKIALYEIQTGHHSPDQWAKDTCDRRCLQWLGLGIAPSRSRWYAFRDRVGPLLETFHRQILEGAVAQGLTTASRGSLDGMLICDLERRKTIALLPDREAATAEAWLSGQPQIAVVARDRGGGYALAAQKALPNAVQVADRCHLMENASHAFLDAVRKSMRQIRSAIGAATINPDLLTAAEKLQYEGYLRREETNAAILAMAKEGATIKEIVRSAGYSRGLVRKVLRGQRSDVFRVRSSSLEAYLPWLDEQWAAGRRNGSELWRSLKQRGFRGCLRVVSEWSGRRRRSERMDASSISRAPSARTVARLMTIGRDQLSKAETVTVAAIESGVESLVEAREVVADFQAMIRRMAPAELDPWIERAKTSLVAALANGVTKDKAAVSAALSSGWSLAKPKVKSASSSWSSARCMGEENSISSKRASSA